MTSSLLYWALGAVLVFWGVGAYNRLVRLRAEVKAAFAAIDAELQPLAQLAQMLLPEVAQGDEADGQGCPPFLAPIEGASAQLLASLAAARARPLDGERIAALGTASDAWDLAWDRAEREDAHDLAGPRLPEPLTALRARRVQHAQAAATRFNDSVDRYNDAIGQFPALLLAWVFGFKRARAL
jgi:LemA protein